MLTPWRCGRTTVSGAAGRPTLRRRNGDRAEVLAVAHLSELGWTILATGLRIGRDEVDILALDPGPRGELVVIEVRSHTTGRFGTPEESV
ncbi:MAG: YraN family protein, partial [Chloroflexi bacterium]|nr:YraN family protein [Chloroflexota bacterium]